MCTLSQKEAPEGTEQVTDSTTPDISIVAPAFNEAETLPVFYQRTVDTLESTGLSFELILVDDGSHDATPLVLAGLHRSDPRIKVISLSRNFGHQIAITAGLDFASGDAVVVIDSDLQDPPEVIVELIARWRDGYDVVYAV